MAQCGICEQREGVREAGVYMDGEKKTVPVCAHCVYEAMRKNFYSIGFGAGLQLCWFVVASKGLASLPGMFAAVIALYGLVRLVMLLAARLVLRAAQAKGGPVPEWTWKYAMARAVTEDALRDAYAEQFCNVKVQTPRVCGLRKQNRLYAPCAHAEKREKGLRRGRPAWRALALSAAAAG